MRGHIPLVVTHDPEIGMGEEWGKPHARRWTAETLQSTEQLWRERTIVLLGDVVYSRDCMDRIFREPAEFMVFGHEYEVFAFVFRIGVWEQMKLALEMAVKHAEQGGPGKLRTVYQAFCGLEMGGNATEEKHWHRICYVQDYTMDVDTPEDWDILLRKVKQNRVRE
jgi:choline kinase